MNEHEVTFSVLGPVRAMAGAEEIVLGPPQQRSVFALLLLRVGRPVSTEEMIAGLWGPDAPDAARTSVRSYVSRLRSLLAVLPDVEIVSRHGGYALERPDGSLDAEQVEREVAAAAAAESGADPARARALLSQAAARWDGIPLTGLSGPFVTQQRTRLVETRASVLEHRIRLDIDAGAHAAVIPELAALVGDYPLRENLREQLMRALHAAGRQAEALTVYAETRALLAEHLGVDPGPALQSLHQQILRSGPAAAGAPRPAPRGLRRPAQLPADLPDFTGREEQTASLVRRLTACDTQRVVAISGVGGSGKTSLAVHAAHRVRPQFPDGQIYIDLAGVSDAPVEPAAALMTFLVALGVPASAVPDDLAGRSALLRSLLAERRVLLLLDNARDAEQVLPLLPGYPGSAAIATSRGILSTLTSSVVELDSFSPDEAMRLMDTAVGAAVLDGDRDVATGLLADVGHLPLAVRIISSQLISRPGRRVPELARRYRDRRQVLGALRSRQLDVQQCFDLSYRQLSPRAAAAFRLLSWPDLPSVSLSCAALLLGADENETEELLDEVIDAGLLQAAAGMRYRFHDLVRLYAHRQLHAAEGEADIEAAASRLLDGLVAVLRCAYRTVTPGHRMADLLTSKAPDVDHVATVAEAADWFVAEHDVLFAAVGKAVEMSAEQVVLTARVLLGMAPLLEIVHGWHEVVAPARRIAERAADAGLIEAEAIARHLCASALWQVDQLQEVLHNAEQSARLCRSIGNEVLLAAAVTTAAFIHARTGHPDEARTELFATLELHERSGNPSGSATALGTLGYMDCSDGHLVGALRYLRRSLGIYRELGDVVGQAWLTTWIGRVLNTMGRPAEALEHLEEGRHLASRLGMRHVEAMNMVTVAHVRLAGGQVDGAIAIAADAVELCRAIGVPRTSASARRILDRARETAAREGSLLPGT